RRVDHIPSWPQRHYNPTHRLRVLRVHELDRLGDLTDRVALQRELVEHHHPVHRGQVNPHDTSQMSDPRVDPDERQHVRWQLLKFGNDVRVWRERVVDRASEMNEPARLTGLTLSIRVFRE